jgi:mRNA interferase RelE/StbE
MRLVLAPRAAKQYQELEPKLQALVDKQFKLLLDNLRHPSLKAKKYDEVRDIWQGRVNRDYRFYFRIRDDVYDILAITKHPK